MARNQGGSSNFQLGDYVEVKDRVAQFWALYPDGRIETDPPEGLNLDGRFFISATARVYKHRDNPTPDATGSAWEQFPGKTPYTKDSEAMNAETSAIGRALGFLNIGIGGSLASAEEVRNRNEERNAPAPDPVPDGALRKDDAKKHVVAQLKKLYPNGNDEWVKATAGSVWKDSEADKNLTEINGAPYLLAPEVAVLDEVLVDAVAAMREGTAA